MWRRQREAKLRCNMRLDVVSHHSSLLPYHATFDLPRLPSPPTPSPPPPAAGTFQLSPPLRPRESAALRNNRAIVFLGERWRTTKRKKRTEQLLPSLSLKVLHAAV